MGLCLVAMLVGGWQAPGGATPSESAIPAARQANNVAIIPINGEINRITVMSVRRRLRIAEDGGADAVVFEMNSPGGELGAVLEISALIKDSAITNTVAWIHPQAFSGGAVIALACREIVASDTAALGDAFPITFGIKGVQALPADLRPKALPPLLADLTDSARRSGFDEYIVQAIAMDGIELWYVQNTRTGQRIAIDEAEYRMLFDGEPMRGKPMLATGAGGGRPAPTAGDRSGRGPSAAARPLVGERDRFHPASGSLADVQDEISARLVEPTRRPSLSPADRGDWQLVPGAPYLTDGSGAVVMRADQLRSLGFAAAEVNNERELKAFFGATNLRRIERSWSEGLVAFLTNPIVRGVLIVILLIAAFLEMASPGVALPGAVAVGALVALAGPPMLANLASWWEIAAIIAGIFLIVIEILVIPGFGIFGVAGMVLLFGGLVFTFVPEPAEGLFPDSPRAGRDLLYGTVTVILSMATSGVGIYFLAKNFATIPLLGRLVLKDPDTNELDRDELITTIGDHRPRSLDIGAVGRCVTALRPVGTAQFGEEIRDVRATLTYIEAGTPVRIVAFGDLSEPMVEPVPEAHGDRAGGGPGA